MAGPQPSIAAPAGWESGSGPASASLSPRCSLPAAARHLLLTQHWLKAEILSSLHPQGSVEGAAREHVGEMVHRSVRLSIPAQTTGLEQGGLFPGVAATFHDGKAGGARQSPVPSVGTSGGLCPRAAVPRLRDHTFCFLLYFAS